MGRTFAWNGQELSIPDAYSALDLNRLLTPTSAGIGIVALVGESDGGKPGLHVLPGGASSRVVKNELKNGPGANMARLALRSGVDPLVQGGASTVLFYKTNNSTRSQLIVGGIAEARSVTLGPDVAGSLNSTYLDKLFSGPNGDEYYVWFNINGAGVDPALAGKTGIEVAGATGVTAINLATAMRAALNAVTGAPFVVGGTNAVVTIQNKQKGPVADLVDGAAPTGFGIVIDTQGANGAPAAFTIKTKQYGAFTALYTADLSQSLGLTFLTIRDENGVPEMSVGVGSKTFFSINRDTSGGAVAAQVRLQYSASLLRLQGQHNLGAGLVSAFDIDVTALTLQQVKTLIEGTYAGWTVTIPNIGDQQLKIVNMDMQLYYQGCYNATSYGFLASVYELIQWATVSSQLVEIVRGSENDVDGVPIGLPLSSLTGGTRGTTANSGHQAALDALLALRINILVPLFSSDNQDGSTVTIAAINSQVKDHVTNRSSILGRSECQAYCSIKGNKTAFKAEAARINSRWVSLVSQSVNDLDINGTPVDHPEFGLAVVAAQTQAGSPVGTPLLERALPSSGISQDASWTPVVDASEMIKAGCLIAGVDDNNTLRFLNGYTTWLQDTNNANIFIETVESLAVFAFNHRQFMKARFKGQSAFTRAAILDAIDESERFELESAKSIKGFDKDLTKILQASGGVLMYDLAVVPWEGIVFILPTIVAVREAA